MYVSHLSAAKFWRVPYIEAVIGRKITEAEPVHITVSSNRARFSASGKIVHSCELDLPSGAIITRYGFAVASPELVFLQLASELNIHRLILLGLQLCSHPQGQPYMAITSKQKIKAFLSRTSGHRGDRKALRAIKYVENGSASVMESLAYMILALPHALGGYGLNGATFNHEVRLGSEVRKRLGMNRFFADLYYKQAKLAVEYDSFTHHSTPTEQGRDAIRSEILKRQGVEVMHLSTLQLYDADACRDFAHNAARHIGKRINIRTKEFSEMHATYGTSLPDSKDDTESGQMPDAMGINGDGQMPDAKGINGDRQMPDANGITWDRQMPDAKGITDFELKPDGKNAEEPGQLPCGSAETGSA